ncbi:MAG: hypothetical protein U9P88_00010 [Patescibacteria group bacterium]|nr:hypothetical protein [Patescibacteria group bacterium]
MAKLSTQEILEIEQIRDGVIILKDKSLRGILMVSSINFFLLSADSQQAIINRFQEFLNSLDFPCQILIQSRNINITGYLDKIKDLEKNQKNELLQFQIAEYHKFIKELVETRNIMTKLFFLIIPYYQTVMSTKKQMKTFIKKEKSPELTKEEFQRGKSQLLQRIEFASLGLRRCNLTAVPLNTTELIELFWSLYNPKQAERGYYPSIPPELSK